MASFLRFGIDLGGSKIEIVALDQQGNILLRQRSTTPQGDYLATVQAIGQLVTHAEHQLGRSGTVGVGIPGCLNPATGLVKNANSTCLIGKDLKGDLQQLLQRSVKIANDADCFALSEACDGAAAGASSVFAVILGTGVGAGLVLHQKLLQGPNVLSGEWGHNPMPWASPQAIELPCYCGQVNCLETFLSGPGWAQRSALQRSARQIHQAALAGDSICQAALADYCQQLAKALASIINIIDPQVIVLGGGLSNMPELYQQVPKLWGEYVFGGGPLRTELKQAMHGDSSGVRGAAWLWD